MIHVNPALDTETHELLCLLASACGTNKTKLACELIGHGVRSLYVIKEFQRRYDSCNQIYPIKVEDQVRYVIPFPRSAK